MNKVISLIAIALFSVAFTSSDYMEVRFKQLSISEAQAASLNSGQYTLVYFTADWCLPCQILQEGHFRDERIINFINKGFVSIKADYSEKKDIEWYDTYEVRMLPTLIVIDDNGAEIDRIQNIKDTRQLYLFLHQYASQKEGTVQKPLAYKLEDDYKPVADISSATSKGKINNTDKPKAILASYKTTIDNIYSVDIDNYDAGLSIQFGAYNRYGHALNYLAKLQQEGLQVSILEEYVNGRKYYKVVQRATKFEIVNLYNKYQAEGKDCFIRPARLKS